MKNHLIIPTAEPFFMKGGKIGCVLVHGFTGAPKEMRLMGNALNKKGITVVGVRLAGHATTPKDLIRMRWQDWLASVEDGYHFLRGNCTHIFLAGLSLGGILSLVCASRLDVDGVIALSAPFELPRDWRLNFAKPISIFFPWIDKGENDMRDQEIAQKHVDYPAYPTRSIAEVHDLTKVLHKALPRINKPVLLIYSRTDHTVPFTHADKIINLVQTKACEKILIDGSGHVITEDIHREFVFESCFKFINKVAGV